MATQAQAVRTWAREQGFEVGVRGVIAPAIWRAYENAHDGFSREVPTGSASCRCGRQWTGLREAHCTVCHRHFSTPRNFDYHRQATENATVCLDPTEVSVEGGHAMRAKDTVWGPLYVLDKEHYLTGDDSGLYDDND